MLTVLEVKKGSWSPLNYVTTRSESVGEEVFCDYSGTEFNTAPYPAKVVSVTRKTTTVVFPDESIREFHASRILPFGLDKFSDFVMANGEMLVTSAPPSSTLFFGKVWRFEADGWGPGLGLGEYKKWQGDLVEVTESFLLSRGCDPSEIASAMKARRFDRRMLALESLMVKYCNIERAAPFSPISVAPASVAPSAGAVIGTETATAKSKKGLSVFTDSHNESVTSSPSVDDKGKGNGKNEKKEEDEDEDENWVWNFHSHIVGDSRPACDTRGCSRRACCVWHANHPEGYVPAKRRKRGGGGSNSKSKSKSKGPEKVWKACIVCQEKDFGGFPDFILPFPSADSEVICTKINELGITRVVTMRKKEPEKWQCANCALENVKGLHACTYCGHPSPLNTKAKAMNTANASSGATPPSGETSGVIDLISDSSDGEDDVAIKKEPAPAVGFGEADQPPDVIEVRAPALSEVNPPSPVRKISDRAAASRPRKKAKTTAKTTKVKSKVVTLDDDNDSPSSDDNDGDVQFIGSNATHVGDMAHPRDACPHYPFERGTAVSADRGGWSRTETENNSKVCKNCYCYICCDLASNCKDWGPEGYNLTSSGHSCHCNANSKHGSVRRQFENGRMLHTNAFGRVMLRLAGKSNWLVHPDLEPLVATANTISSSIADSFDSFQSGRRYVRPNMFGGLFGGFFNDYDDDDVMVTHSLNGVVDEVERRIDTVRSRVSDASNLRYTLSRRQTAFACGLMLLSTLTEEFFKHSWKLPPFDGRYRHSIDGESEKKYKDCVSKIQDSWNAVILDDMLQSAADASMRDATIQFLKKMRVTVDSTLVDFGSLESAAHRGWGKGSDAVLYKLSRGLSKNNNDDADIIALRLNTDLMLEADSFKKYRFDHLMKLGKEGATFRRSALVYSAAVRELELAANVAVLDEEYDKSLSLLLDVESFQKARIITTIETLSYLVAKFQRQQDGRLVAGFPEDQRKIKRDFEFSAPTLTPESLTIAVLHFVKNVEPNEVHLLGGLRARGADGSFCPFWTTIYRLMVAITKVDEVKYVEELRKEITRENLSFSSSAVARVKLTKRDIRRGDKTCTTRRCAREYAISVLNAEKIDVKQLKIEHSSHCPDILACVIGMLCSKSKMIKEKNYGCDNPGCDCGIDVEAGSAKHIQEVFGEMNQRGDYASIISVLHAAEYDFSISNKECNLVAGKLVKMPFLSLIPRRTLSKACVSWHYSGPPFFSNDFDNRLPLSELPNSLLRRLGNDDTTPLRYSESANVAVKLFCEGDIDSGLRIWSRMSETISSPTTQMSASSGGFINAFMDVLDRLGPLPASIFTDDAIKESFSKLRDLIRRGIDLGDKRELNDCRQRQARVINVYHLFKQRCEVLGLYDKRTEALFRAAALSQYEWPEKMAYRIYAGDYDKAYDALVKADKRAVSTADVECCARAITESKFNSDFFSRVMSNLGKKILVSAKKAAFTLQFKAATSTSAGYDCTNSKLATIAFAFLSHTELHPTSPHVATVTRLLDSLIKAEIDMVNNARKFKLNQRNGEPYLGFVDTKFLELLAKGTLAKINAGEIDLNDGKKEMAIVFEFHSNFVNTLELEFPSSSADGVIANLVKALHINRHLYEPFLDERSDIMLHIISLLTKHSSYRIEHGGCLPKIIESRSESKNNESVDSFWQLEIERAISHAVDIGSAVYSNILSENESLRTCSCSNGDDVPIQSIVEAYFGDKPHEDLILTHGYEEALFTFVVGPGSLMGEGGIIERLFVEYILPSCIRSSLKRLTTPGVSPDTKERNWVLVLERAMNKLLINRCNPPLFHFVRIFTKSHHLMTKSVENLLLSVWKGGESVTSPDQLRSEEEVKVRMDKYMKILFDFTCRFADGLGTEFSVPTVLATACKGVVGKISFNKKKTYQIVYEVPAVLMKSFTRNMMASIDNGAFLGTTDYLLALTSIMEAVPRLGKVTAASSNIDGDDDDDGGNNNLAKNAKLAITFLVKHFATRRLQRYPTTYLLPPDTSAVPALRRGLRSKLWTTGGCKIFQKMADSKELVTLGLKATDLDKFAFDIFVYLVNPCQSTYDALCKPKDQHCVQILRALDDVVEGIPSHAGMSLVRMIKSGKTTKLNRICASSLKSSSSAELFRDIFSGITSLPDEKLVPVLHDLPYLLNFIGHNSLCELADTQRCYFQKNFAYDEQLGQVEGRSGSNELRVVKEFTTPERNATVAGIKKLRNWIDNATARLFASLKSRPAEVYKVIQISFIVNQTESTYLESIERLKKERLPPGKSRRENLQKFNDFVMDFFLDPQYFSSALCQTNRLGVLGLMARLDERLNPLEGDEWLDIRSQISGSMARIDPNTPRSEQLLLYNKYFTCLVGTFNELSPNKHHFQRLDWAIADSYNVKLKAADKVFNGNVASTLHSAITRYPTVAEAMLMHMITGLQVLHSNYGASTTTYFTKKSKDCFNLAAQHGQLEFCRDSDFKNFIKNKELSSWKSFSKSNSDFLVSSGATTIRLALEYAEAMRNPWELRILEVYGDLHKLDKFGVPLYRLKCQKNDEWDEHERTSRRAAVKDALVKLAEDHGDDVAASASNQIEKGRKIMQSSLSRNTGYGYEYGITKQFDFWGLLGAVLLDEISAGPISHAIRYFVDYGPIKSGEFMDRLVSIYDNSSWKERTYSVSPSPYWTVFLRDILAAPSYSTTTNLLVQTVAKYCRANEKAEGEDFLLGMFRTGSFYLGPRSRSRNYNGEVFTTDEIERIGKFSVLFTEYLTKRADALGRSLEREQCNLNRKKLAVTQVEELHKVSKRVGQLDAVRDRIVGGLYPIRTRKKAVITFIYSGVNAAAKKDIFTAEACNRLNIKLR